MRVDRVPGPKPDTRAGEGAVERPVIVQREEVSDSIAPPLGLAPADFLARVLDDLAPRRHGVHRRGGPAPPGYK